MSFGSEEVFGASALPAKQAKCAKTFEQVSYLAKLHLEQLTLAFSVQFSFGLRFASIPHFLHS